MIISSAFVLTAYERDLPPNQTRRETFILTPAQVTPTPTATSKPNPTVKATREPQENSKADSSVILRPRSTPCNA